MGLIGYATHMATQVVTAINYTRKYKKHRLVSATKYSRFTYVVKRR